MTYAPPPTMHVAVMRVNTPAPLAAVAQTHELAQAEAERVWVERNGPFCDEEARQNWLARLEHATMQGDEAVVRRLLPDAFFAKEPEDTSGIVAHLRRALPADWKQVCTGRKGGSGLFWWEDRDMAAYLEIGGARVYIYWYNRGKGQAGSSIAALGKMCNTRDELDETIPEVVAKHALAQAELNGVIPDVPEWAKQAFHAQRALRLQELAEKEAHYQKKMAHIVAVRALLVP